MDATVLYGCLLSYYLCFLHWCLLQNTSREHSEVGIGMEISLLQDLFILLPDFSSRCFGTLASREVGRKLVSVSSWKRIRSRDVAGIFKKSKPKLLFSEILIREISK